MMYFDYAATTPLDPQVLETMLPLLKENFGNPDSAHFYGRKAAYAVSEARAKIAEIAGVSSSEVYFTSGGTEADNWAVRYMNAGRAAVSEIEHKAVIEAAKMREGGFCFIPCDAGGKVTEEAVEQAVAEKTGLVCVMAANNETGVIQPLDKIYRICRTRGIPLFSDCIQAAATLDLKELTRNTDALSLSAHKLYGPKGAGALIVKKGTRLSPLIVGGEQERSLRGGTLNAAAIAGFAAALEKVQTEREKNFEHVKRMRDLFEQWVCSIFGEQVRVNGANRLPNISHLTFFNGDHLIEKLDLKGVCVSGGAACSAHSPLPSHVLIAMGQSEAEAKLGVRFSFGKETDEDEVLQAVQILKEILAPD